MAKEDNLRSWPKGVSGNPKGMKPGTKHIRTWIQELLNDEEFTTLVREGVQLKEYKGAPLKAMIQAQIRLAIGGDTKAFDALAKHGWKAELDIMSDGEKIEPVIIYRPEKLPE